MHLPTVQILKMIAEERLPKDDPSHDISHSFRVLGNMKRIVQSVPADMEILTPAALFHDLVNLPKDSPHAREAPRLSAEAARVILTDIEDYPLEKIAEVERCIGECSFGNHARPTSVESAILQDADALESVGVIAIMRTFASSGILKRGFYHPQDPFCEIRKPDPRNFAVDLFFSRLFLVYERLNTEPAREMAKQREKFMHAFLRQLGEEIGQPYPG